MSRSHPSPPSRIGLLTRWLVKLAIPAVLLVGCSDSDHSGASPTPTSTAVHTSTPTVVPTPTPTLSSSASAACAKLAGCDQCFIHQTGQCLSVDACAQRLAADVAICINSTNGCAQDMLGDCLFPGCQGIDASGECQ